MKRKLSIKLFLSLLITVVFALSLSANANAQTQKVKAALRSDTTAQQPLYTEYKGVRLGMSTEEARAKLGTPALKASDQDYYIFSENETAQICYDAAQKVVTISVDYLGGIGAPDYKTVVGGELEQRPNGALYRSVRYESQRFWVSYSRATGPVTSVTVTIQKF